MNFTEEILARQSERREKKYKQDLELLRNLRKEITDGFVFEMVATIERTLRLENAQEVRLESMGNPVGRWRVVESIEEEDARDLLSYVFMGLKEGEGIAVSAWTMGESTNLAYTCGRAPEILSVNFAPAIEAYDKGIATILRSDVWDRREEEFFWERNYKEGRIEKTLFDRSIAKAFLEKPITEEE